MNKKEYLKLHSKIYDQIYLSDNKIVNNKVKFEMLPDISSTEGNQFKRMNIKALIEDLNLLIAEINFNLEHAVAYDHLYNENPIKIVSIYKNIYTKNVISCICTFKDRVTFLLRELIEKETWYGNEINSNKARDVSFNKYFNQIKNRNYKNLANNDSLEENEFLEIIRYFEEMNKINSRIYSLRNLNTHRRGVHIDLLGAVFWSRERGVDEREEVKSDDKLAENRVAITKEESEKMNAKEIEEYIIKSFKGQNIKSWDKITLSNDRFNFIDIMNEIDRLLNQYNKLNCKLFSSFKIDKYDY